MSATRIIRWLLWAVGALIAAVFLSTYWAQPALVSPSGTVIVAETAFAIWAVRCLYLSLIAFAIFREVCRLTPDPRWDYNPLFMVAIISLLFLGTYGVLIFTG